MKSKKKTIIICISLIFTSAIIYGGFFLYGFLKRTTNSPVSKNADRIEKWAADLKYVKSKLPRLHKNLYFSMKKSDFIAGMDDLIAKAGKYSDLELTGGLAKIVNSVGDSHTSLDIQGNLIYPLSLFEFEDGIYVGNASMTYKNLWGKRLTGINGYSVEQLHSMLAPYVAHDNKAIIKNQFSSMLRFPQILRIAGIAKDNNTVFTFEGSPELNVNLKATTLSTYQNTKYLTDDPGYVKKFPLSKHNPYKNYWYEYLPKENAIYVKYNSCSNIKGYSFSAFTKDVFKELDAKKAKALILDLRDNGGGDSRVFSPFIKEVKRRKVINNKESLYVIVGRRTFSSAILNAMDMKNHTNASIIGEPTGGKPNHFGEVKVLHLSNVNLNIYYSSNYFKTSNINTDSLYPDISIPLNASSYFIGRDDFLEYIFHKVDAGH